MVELAHWIAFDRRTPIGDEQFDLLFANLCRVACGVAGEKKKGGGAFSLDDFRLFKMPEKEKTPLELMQAILGNRVVKGKPKRGRNKAK